MTPQLPGWAEQMRELFMSGSAAQFLIHGNIFDVVGIEDKGGRQLSLKAFLRDVMFENYDVVLEYDRGRGIRPVKGAEDWGDWLKQILGNESATLQTRESGTALELIDRYLLRTLNLQAVRGREESPNKIAVIIDFAEFVVPRGDPVQLSGPFSANIVKVLGWANDPAILHSNIVTVLLTEGLHDLNPLVVENPHIASLKIPLPSEEEMLSYLQSLIATQFPQLPSKSEVSIDVLARRLTGLSRVGARRILSTAITNDRAITAAWLLRMKKDLIERECQDLLEFLEFPFTLDQVAGHEPVKAWLREDMQLLRRGLLNALPMGYLITGRIGTGKTFIVQ
jgi:hypothetical protein